jgi:hypothetical protein
MLSMAKKGIKRTDGSLDCVVPNSTLEMSTFVELQHNLLLN